MTIYLEIETKETYTETEVAKMAEMFEALISTGGLLGMKNGSTNIHFDKKGQFQAIRLEYMPWRRFDK